MIPKSHAFRKGSFGGDLHNEDALLIISGFTLVTVAWGTVLHHPMPPCCFCLAATSHGLSLMKPNYISPPLSCRFQVLCSRNGETANLQANLVFKTGHASSYYDTVFGQNTELH